jgi:plastocyanin
VRCVAAIAAGVLALGAWTATASGALPGVVAQDDEYMPPNWDVAEGGEVQFFNAGPNHDHSLTADDSAPEGGPLFDSGVIGPTEDTPVAGVHFLTAGVYDFHCRIHSNMHATLTVLDSAQGAAPRPSIDVKVKSKKLEKVVSSGKLKVKVSAGEPTDAEGISLQGSKGRKKITKQANLDLAAGDSKTAKLKVKKSAAEKLADLDKVKVKVTGTVDFGSGDKASKKLK